MMNEIEMHKSALKAKADLLEDNISDTVTEMFSYQSVKEEVVYQVKHQLTDKLNLRKRQVDEDLKEESFGGMVLNVVKSLVINYFKR